MRHLFEGVEGKMLWYIVLITSLGIALVSLADGTFVHEMTPYVTSLPKLVEHLGVAMIVGSVVIVVIEVGLRKDMLRDIENVFRKQQPSQYLVSLRLRRTDYNDRITGDMKLALPGDMVSIIGISQRSMFDDHPGVRELEKKVREGCHFRIMVLHPESSLVDSIEALSRDFGFPDLRESLRYNVTGPIAQLASHLNKNRNYKGSLEIRLHRDIFSTVAYYASPRMTVVGLYLSHTAGTLCPAFEVATDEELLPVTRQHFETMWKQCADTVLIGFSPRAVTNNIVAVIDALSKKTIPNALS